MLPQHPGHAGPARRRGLLLKSRSLDGIRSIRCPDSMDAISMVFAAHHAMTGRIDASPAWWIHQIVVDDVVVGDIGFHGPPGPERTVEIGYCVVPAWRRRGVASQACNLICASRLGRTVLKLSSLRLIMTMSHRRRSLLANGFQPSI